MDHAKKIKVYLKQDSALAGLASLLLKQSCMALVLGHTIHLYGVKPEFFLKDKRWVLHELAHVQQFKTYGLFGFLCRYGWESVKKGYRNNRYEIEARLAEERSEPGLEVEMISRG